MAALSRIGVLAACLLGCGGATRVWIAGDVQVEQDAAATLSALTALRGIGIVNLEGPVAAAKPAGAGIRLHNAPEVPAALAAVGVGAVSLANNHSADAGPEGLEASVAALRRAGLAPIRGGEAAVIDGVRVLAVYTESPAAIAAAVRALPRPVIVSLHVLAPPSYVPAATTRARVEAAVGAGAAVVAVHGSHAIAAVERRGRQVVAWGLGNVAFHCGCTQEDEAMALEVALDVHGVREATIVPLRAGLRGAPTRLEPEPSVVFDLLKALGSGPLIPDGGRAHLLDGGR